MIEPILKTKRISYGLLAWLTVLIIDRLTRSLSVTLFAATGVDEWFVRDGVWLFVGKVAFAYRNVMHYVDPVPVTELWLGYGIFALLLSVMLGFAYYLKQQQQVLIPLVFLLGGISSNWADFIIWGAVSDPLTVGITKVVTNAFNIADVCIILGFVAYWIVLIRSVK